MPLDFLHSFFLNSFLNDDIHCGEKNDTRKNTIRKNIFNKNVVKKYAKCYSLTQQSSLIKLFNLKLTKNEYHMVLTCKKNKTVRIKSQANKSQLALCHRKSRLRSLQFAHLWAPQKRKLMMKWSTFEARYNIQATNNWNKLNDHPCENRKFESVGLVCPCANETNNTHRAATISQNLRLTEFEIISVTS